MRYGLQALRIVAVYNQEHTIQAMDWCFGGEVSSAPSTIGLPPNFPPRR